MARDCADNEARVSAIATGRRRQVSAAFAGARTSLMAFLLRAALSVQAFVAARQAELIAAVARALAWVRSTILGALAAARASAARLRARIADAIARARRAVRETVTDVTGRITDLIDSIPLPDLPGPGWLRSAARRVMNGIVGVVTGTLDGILGLIGRALDAALRALDGLLAMVATVVDFLLSLFTSAILAVLRTIAAALNRAVAFITNALRRVLLAVLRPVLALVERAMLALIGLLERRMIALLRQNRDEYLTALADALVPVAPPAGARAATVATQIAFLQQLTRDAVESARAIVRTFDTIFVVVAAIVRTVASAVARILSFVWNMLAQLFRIIAALVALVVRLIRQLVDWIVAVLELLWRIFVFALDSLFEALGALLDGNVSKFADYLWSGFRQLGSFAVRFVEDLIAGKGIVESFVDALGVFLPTRPGLLFKPPPPPPPGTIVGIILAIVVIAALFGVTVIVAGSVVIIIIGGVVYTLPVWVVLVAFVVVVLLLVLIIWLIWRWLTKPKKPPGKRVIRVTPSKLELGVGGRVIQATATIAPGTPPRPPLVWTINPGSTVPAAVSILGTGQRVGVRADHPPHGTVVGGSPITVRAALAADPADFADSASVMMVQILTSLYAATPPLVAIASAHRPIAPSPNTAEPNRDGISGNTVAVNTTTAPAGRAVNVTFRRSLGATVAGTIVTPGRTTGDIGLRITDPPTEARLDETRPSTVAPPMPMADVTVNAVPTRVTATTFDSMNPPPYGVNNEVTFATSDALHPPLMRVTGELITGVRDDFGLPPPNGAFNPVYDPNLAVPASAWVDQLFLRQQHPAVLPQVDVNRFVGTTPGLPRFLIYRQRFVYSSWRGSAPGADISSVLADGQHIKILQGTPPSSFTFKIEHRFPGATPSTPAAEPYSGNPLIILSNITVTPTAPGASALAADGVAIAALGVTTTVAGRPVLWTVRSGDIVIVGTNPVTPPATATLRAGVTVGNFGVSAADTVFAHRQVSGRVDVVAVKLQNMHASPNPVPSGVASSTVSLDANPGGRTVHWSVDAVSAAAGVTISPRRPVPGHRRRAPRSPARPASPGLSRSPRPTRC